MQLIRDNPGRQLLRSSVVTIGNFDGLHLGHQALIRRSRSLSGGERPVVVLTFEPPPQTWFGPECAPARLMSVRQKLDSLTNAGVDLVWLMRFNRVLAEMSAEEFLQAAVVEVLAPDVVVVGDDFRFGKDRQGNIDTLRRAGNKHGFELSTVATQEVDGQRVSSSVIRACLAAGDLGQAACFLNRPFRMEGKVFRGRQLGRQLGFPTANLRLAVAPSPVAGIFAVKARWTDSGWRDGVANLGTRPAVGGGSFLVEVHLFDFNGDLYGQRLEVEFVKKLRDEANFAAIDDLVVQMREDERQARQALNYLQA